MITSRYLKCQTSGECHRFADLATVLAVENGLCSQYVLSTLQSLIRVLHSYGRYVAFNVSSDGDLNFLAYYGVSQILQFMFITKP